MDAIIRVISYITAVIASLAVGAAGAVLGAVAAGGVCAVIFLVIVTYNAFNGIPPFASNTAAAFYTSLGMLKWLAGIFAVLGVVHHGLTHLNERLRRMH